MISSVVDSQADGQMQFSYYVFALPNLCEEHMIKLDGSS